MKVKSFMKNTWHLLACLMLLVACSDDKVEDETTITLPPKTETLFEKGVNFTTSAGTQSLEFTATENWNITAATIGMVKSGIKFIPLVEVPERQKFLSVLRIMIVMMNVALLLLLMPVKLRKH